jgi:HEAT repeat protein
MQYPIPRRWVCFGLPVTALTLILAGSISAAEKSDDAMAKIEAMIEKIRAEHSPLVRVNVAEQLAVFLQHQDRSCLNTLDAKVIDDIASLLSDKDDAVRYWAALALGNIGAPAIRVVPSLEKALKDVEPAPGSGVIGPDLSSASAIQGALQKITGKPFKD